MERVRDDDDAGFTELSPETMFKLRYNGSCNESVFGAGMTARTSSCESNLWTFMTTSGISSI